MADEEQNAKGQPPRLTGERVSLDHGRLSIQEYCLFRFAPTINGDPLPETRLKITRDMMSVADFEESIRGINILAWARFHQLLLKCSEHPEFDAWCEQLGLKLEIEGCESVSEP